MEIKFENVGYKSNLSYASFVIGPSITGIIGKNKEVVVDMILSTLYPMVGSIYIGNVLSCDENKDKILKNVAIVRQEISKDFLEYSVMHHIARTLDQSNYMNNSITTRMKDALKMVGLDESYLTRKIKTLSSGEAKLMMMATALIPNPKILIIEEPVLNLDLNNKKKVLKLIRLLREKYHKTILLVSEDSNFLYQYTDHILFTDDCNAITMYRSEEAFLNIDLLLSHDVEIPKLVKFTYKANQKGAKLHYHKDIRDLIKDIYKHV